MESKKLFYKIGEVCDLTGLKPSVLRFWEKEFKQLRPSKSHSNHRYYTDKHIELIGELKTMLYDEKLTIEGAKKRLESKCRAATDISENTLSSESGEHMLSFVKDELKNILSVLKNHT